MFVLPRVYDLFNLLWKLFYAVEQGNLSEIEEYLNRGANVLARNSHHTVLHSAVRSNKEEVIALVLNKIKETHGNVSPYIDAKDTEGDTPLMWTAESSYVNAARVLLEYGADIRAKNNNGMTALHWAAKNNCIEVMKLLIDKGANINVQDNGGRTPSDLAKKGGHEKILEYLTFSQELFSAVEQSNLSKIKEYLNGGANVLARNSHHTVLHSAVCSNKEEVIALVLNKIKETHGNVSPYIDAKDTEGDTPLMWAAESSYVNAARILLEYGADIGAKNNDGMTALHWAARNNYIEVMKLLIDKGANINVQDNGESTPLDFAKKERHGRIVGYLTFSTAETFRKQGKYSEACQAYQGALNIQEVVLGPDHLDTLITRHSMAEALDGQGKYSEALRIYQSVFERSKDVLGPDHSYTLTAHYSMAKVLSDQGKYSEAVNIYQEVLKKEEEILGSDHADTLMTRFNMAGVLANQGKYREAFSIYQEIFYIQKRRDISSPDYPDTLVTWFNMAGVLANQGKHHEALMIFQKVLNIQEAKLGSNHPITLLTSRNIEIIQREKMSIDSHLSEKVGDKKAKDGNIPSDLAIANGHGEIVDILDGLNTERKSPTYASLHDAAKNGDWEMVKFLIEKGKDFKSQDGDGNTPLHWIIRNCGKEEVKVFIKCVRNTNPHQFNQFINAQDSRYRTSLHLAVSLNKLDILRLLIEEGADLNAKDKDHNTPLHLAAYEGYLGIVKLLIANGAVYNQLNNNRKTPKELSTQREIISFLDDIDNLFDTIKSSGLFIFSRVSSIVQSIMNGREAEFIAVRDNESRTLLDRAIEYNRIGTMQYLVEKGADLNSRNNNGETPLHLATCKGHLDAAKFLIDKGANINAVETFTDYKKPIHIAAREGHKSILEFLLSKGVSINEVDQDGWTPLHYAALKGCLDAVKFLIDKGANINAKASNGNTPLDLATSTQVKNFLKQPQLDLINAANQGNLELVKEYVSKWVILDAKDEDGYTYKDYGTKLPRKTLCSQERFNKCNGWSTIWLLLHK